MTSIVDNYARTRRWRRPEYERLVQLGIFVGERLELLDGALVVREPQGSRHAAIVGHVGEVLRAAFREGGTSACRPHSRSTTSPCRSPMSQS